MAAAFAAGNFLGLAAAPAAVIDSAPVVALVGAACMLAGRVGLIRVGKSERHFGSGRSTILTLGLTLLAGFAIGVPAGQRSHRACTTSIPAGAPVLVSGTLLDRLPRRDETREDRPGGPRTSVRIRVAETTLVATGRRCELPQVRAFARPDTVSRPAGSRVLLSGAWRSPGRLRFPRPAASHGWVGGAMVQSSSGVVSGLAAWRGALTSRLESRLSTRHAPLGKALVLADRSTLAPEVRDTFAQAGIVHLLAISGLHVGLIGASVAWLIGLVVPGPKRRLYAAGITGGYVLLIGAPPSAVRAALMLGGYALAAHRLRPARVSDVAALAAILALLAEPLVITEPGFQLSYAGFAGVVLGARVSLPRFFGPLRRSTILRAVAVSTGAFLATAPIAAWHFDRIVPASIPASVLAAPVVALALPALALTLLLPAPLAMVMGGAADMLLAALSAIASWFALLPLSWSDAVLGRQVLVVSVLIAAVALDRLSRRSGAGVLAVGLAIGLQAGWGSVRGSLSRGQALVCTLDVGQGDAAVVRTGAGRWLVFDAGPGSGFREGSESPGPPSMGEAGSRVVVPFLRALGARSVELLAVSHPHLDHFGGAADVFDAFDVRTVIDPAVVEPSGAYRSFLGWTRREGSRWIAARAGDRFRIDDVDLEVLWPRGEHSDANRGSLAFRLTVGGFRYINTGDAPVEVELAIMTDYGSADLAADLLKLGHHGSHTSSALEWLRATRPAVAVVSAGRGNSYGHPHPGTLARTDSARIRTVWRTDSQGTLCVQINEEGWRVVTPPVG